MKKEETQNFEGFTLSLALVDMLPVLLFSASGIIVGTFFKSPLFIVGVVVSLLAGIGKVLWKILIAQNGKNIMLLNRQFRFVMPAGFLLIIISIIVGAKNIVFPQIISAVLSLPSLIFFILGFLGLIAMTVFSKLLGNTAKANWVEQITNTFSQGMVLIGLLFLL